MSWYDTEILKTLVDQVVKAVTFGILTGALFSAVFRIKTPPGQ